MITLTKEEAQQVLEAFEGVFEGDDKGAEFWTVYGGTFEAVYCMNAMRLLRAKLAQPERQWQGLTEQEHANIAVEAGCASADWVFYGAAVERALKEKNW